MAKVLLGFMGSGKTTIARKLDSNFVDMDALLEIADLMIYLTQALLQQSKFIFVAVDREGLSVVQKVVVTVLFRCDVGHQYVGARADSLFSPSLVNSLQSCGGGNVDVRHQEAQDSHHLQTQVEPFRERKELFPLCKERCVAIFYIGSHATHVDIELFHKEQIVG